jgi:membrane protease YdiL (CAAX protease family)
MTAVVLSYIWLWQRSFPGSFYLVLALYFGIGYVGHRLRGESLQHLGIRFDNWQPAIRNAAIVIAIAVPTSLIIGATLDSWHFPTWSGAATALPITAVWGTAQQYGLLCVIYRRLVEALGNVHGAMAAAASLFALFHLPNVFLMLVTLAAGSAACVLYRRVPNIFVIGITHAAISFTLYYALPYDITGGLRVGPGYLAIQ